MWKEGVISEVASSGVFEPPSGTSCPICLCELEEPYRGWKPVVMISVRAAWLVNASPPAAPDMGYGFPLCCTKEGCKKLILTVDLRSLLSTKKMEEPFGPYLMVFV